MGNSAAETTAGKTANMVMRNLGMVDGPAGRRERGSWEVLKGNRHDTASAAAFHIDVARALLPVRLSPSAGAHRLLAEAPVGDGDNSNATGASLTGAPPPPDDGQEWPPYLGSIVRRNSRSVGRHRSTRGSRPGSLTRPASRSSRPSSPPGPVSVCGGPVSCRCSILAPRGVSVGREWSTSFRRWGE